MGGYSQLPIAPYRPAENDPMASLQRLMAMKGMMQSQQLQAEAGGQESQLRAGQIQQQQQQIKDTQAATAAMQEWDGKDFTTLPSLVLKHGGSSNIVLPLKQSLLKQQTELQDLANKQQQGISDQFKNEQIKNDWFIQRITDVQGLPPEQQAAAFEKAKSDSVQRGYLDPQHAQQLQYQGPDQLELLRKSFMGHAAALTDAEKRAKLRGETATAEKTEAETAALKASGGMSPLQQEARYRFVLQKLERGEPVGDDDMAAARAFEASKTERHTTSDSLGVTSTNATLPGGLAAAQARGRGGQPGPAGVAPANQAGGAGGGPTPSLRDSVVDEIGQYKASPMLLARTMAKHPEILGLVGQKYPDWNQPDYNAKNKMVTSYTSGPQSKEINAINTAMGHIKVLDDAVAALNNGSVQALNAIANKLGAAVGADPQTTFRTIVHRVGPEITSAYIPGAGGEAERLANAEDFSEKLAPNQLHSNAAISVKLLRSKVGALENQYKNTIGRDDFNQRFITPEARAAFDKFGGQQGGGAPTGGHIINVGGKRYQYKGSGDTADLKNYSEIAK